MPAADGRDRALPVCRRALARVQVDPVSAHAIVPVVVSPDSILCRLVACPRHYAERDAHPEWVHGRQRNRGTRDD